MDLRPQGASAARPGAAKGALQLTAAHLGLSLASYVVAVLLARGLGPSDYGAYGIIYSVLLTIELIGRLGIPQALARLSAERGPGAHRLEATGFTLTVVVSSLLFVGFWVAAPQLASAFRVENGTWLFRVAALDIPVYGLYLLVSNVLNGRRDFGFESLGVMLYSASKVVGILLLLTLGLSIAGALIVNAAASAVALFVIGIRAGGLAFVPTFAFRRELLRLAIPVGLMATGTQLLLSADLWVLSATGGDVSAHTKGLYVAALNLARVPMLLGSVTTAVVVPTLAAALARNDHDEARRTVQGAIRLLTLVMLPGYALSAIESEGLMTFVYSGEYAAGADLFALLFLSHGVMYTVFVTLSAALVAAGRERLAAGIALGILPVTVGLAAMLVKSQGAAGAAAASVLASAGAAAVAGVAVRRHVGSFGDLSVFARSLIASGIVAGLASLRAFEGVWLLAELAAIGVVYLGVLAALGLLTREDVALLRRVFKPGT